MGSLREGGYHQLALVAPRRPGRGRASASGRGRRGSSAPPPRSAARPDRAGGAGRCGGSRPGGRGVAHHHGPVGERDRLADIVGDQHHRRPVLGPEGEQMAVQILAGEGVERRERLVESRTRGSATKARAIETRCCWPPDRSRGQRRHARRGRPAPGRASPVRAAHRASIGQAEADIGRDIEPGRRRGSWNTSPRRDGARRWFPRRG